MRILLDSVLLLAVCGVLVAGSPEHLNFGKQLAASQCNPGVGKLVINVVQHITNDIDSGVAGNYWANDEYNRQIQVWQTDATHFCASVKSQGSFITVLGRSPNDTGNIDAGIAGTIQGGYTAAITGTLLTTPGAKTKGNIGNFDYACNASTGECPGYVSWLGLYFNAGFDFGYTWWGWIYHGGDNGVWVNASTGNSGDIHN